MAIKRKTKVVEVKAPPIEVECSIECKIDATVAKLRAAWDTHVEVNALKAIIIWIIK